MEQVNRDPSFHFTLPFSQIGLMVSVVVAVAIASYLAFPQIGPTFLANKVLNGIIVAVFLIGVGFCFRQVLSLIRSVQWIEGFAAQRVGHQQISPPQMLAPLAALLRQRGARTQLGAGSSRSILDTVATRIDEQREITRYITNTLIFLGLLGTFYGLATTVPALVQTIQSLTPRDGESALDIFARLQAGLEGQLDGMGIAFASSLLGLAGSLVVGLLELFAGHGQNRFYGELEDWLSTITRVGIAAGEDGAATDSTVLAGMMDRMVEQMDGMNQMYAQASTGQADVEARLIGMTTALEKLATKMDTGQTEALERVAAAQEQMLAKMTEDSSDGIDAESRMRLRSIDVQLLRILEELSAGRQQSTAELRTDLANLSKAIRNFARATQAGPNQKG